MSTSLARQLVLQTDDVVLAPLVPRGSSLKIEKDLAGSDSADPALTT
jgi:hypothetical protein